MAKSRGRVAGAALLVSSICWVATGTVSVHAATTALALQMPWLTGSTHNINGGYSYGCGDHTGNDHYAIDFNLPSNTPVAATAAGVAHPLAASSYTDGYGNVIWIDHGGGLVSVYGHLASFNVSDGQWVSQGEQIALSDNTGSSSGPHLHFTMHSSTNLSNPLFTGNPYQPEPMFGLLPGGYTGFGGYGACGANPSPNYKSDPATGGPLAVIVPADNNVNVFFLTQGGDITNDYYSPSQSPPWQGPAGLPGGTGWAASGTSVAAVSAAYGDMHVFFVGTNGQLMNYWYSGGWNGPAGLPGTPLPSTPIVAVSPCCGYMDVFFIASNGTLQHDFYNPSPPGWSNQALPGPPDPGSGLAAPSGGGDHVFFMKGGKLQNDYTCSPGPWCGPALLPGSPAAHTPIAVTSNWSNVFFVDSGGGIWNDWYGNAWSGPAQLPGNDLLGSGLAIPPSSTNAFFVGSPLALDNDWYDSSQVPPWLGPAGLPSSPWSSTPISDVLPLSGSINVFFVNSAGTYSNDWYGSNPPGWAGPTYLPGAPP